MIIDCVADLHGHFPKLEGGDLLIVAGDLTARDELQAYYDFGIWLSNQKYRRKVVIAGNHDNQLKYTKFAFPIDVDFLNDTGCEFEGLKIYGSPWTKSFEGMNPDCMAFTLRTREELAEKWALIPVDVDILITHSPPFGVGDAVTSIHWRNGGEQTIVEHCGSQSLADLLEEGYLKPKLHVFGHIHEGYGVHDVFMDAVDHRNQVKFVNASIMNENYKPVNQPVRIVL